MAEVITAGAGWIWIVIWECFFPSVPRLELTGICFVQNIAVVHKYISLSTIKCQYMFGWNCEPENSLS